MNKNQPVSEHCQGAPFHWVLGNIQRKLTLFVVSILIMIIGLFWFFTVFMLQPAYQSSIRADLSTALSVVLTALNEREAKGEEIMEDGKISAAVIADLNAALKSGSLNLDNRCLDISDANARNVLLVDNLRPSCLLHLSFETGIAPDGSVGMSSEKNGDIITLIRATVLSQGYYDETVNNQIVMGGSTQNGTASVVVSANLERIPQAVMVLKRLLLPLSMLLSLFSVVAAWIFSAWFTRPLSRLSAAAREMAKGNYDVRVEDCGEDEIGDLSRDFNAMAYEVGRSAALQQDLLANVSHDLRTPLTLIKGYAETVRDLTGDDPEKRTQQLNVIVDESDRLSALVGSVLELTKMSSGVQKTEEVDFDLTQLCDEVGYRYWTLCEQNGYHFHFSGEEVCRIHSDPELVERALHNLLGNALKHVGDDGFMGLSVRKTEKNTVRVEVQDNGKGILPEDMPHIFDKYYRSRSDAGKPGTGLGLSITKAIYEALNFDYGVESEVGKGAKFWFEAKLI